MSLKTSTSPNYTSRKLADRAMRGCVLLATGLAIVPLVLIIAYVTVVGGSALSVQFFTDTYRPPDTGLGTLELPAPDPAAPADPSATADPLAGIDLGALTGAEGDPAAPANPADPRATADPLAGVDLGALTGAEGEPSDMGEKGAGLAQAQVTGGVFHAIVGTLIVTGTALLIALPIGLLAGVFLAEYPPNPLGTAVRFCCDVLSGAPSIIVGVTAYVLIVNARGPDGQPLGFSGWAGAVALTFLMVPTITRTTEEVLKLVPEATREAALAMGAPAWYSTFTVVIPTALSGIITGVMLAFARGAGETAPLIMTILGSNVLVTSLLEPIAALPLITYRYTESPYPSENQLAWGSAFVLMMLVLLVNILVRVATRSRLQSR